VAEQWSAGQTRDPWLISTTRFKAVEICVDGQDLMRLKTSWWAISTQWSSAERPNKNEDDSLEDDQLRLVRTCCHHLTVANRL
jgi:predicted RNA polymerase sigma factor